MIFNIKYQHCGHWKHFWDTKIILCYFDVRFYWLVDIVYIIKHTSIIIAIFHLKAFHNPPKKGSYEANSVELLISTRWLRWPNAALISGGLGQSMDVEKYFVWLKNGFGLKTFFGQKSWEQMFGRKFSEVKFFLEKYSFWVKNGWKKFFSGKKLIKQSLVVYFVRWTIFVFG